MKAPPRRKARITSALMGSLLVEGACTTETTKMRTGEHQHGREGEVTYHVRVRYLKQGAHNVLDNELLLSGLLLGGLAALLELLELLLPLLPLLLELVSVDSALAIDFAEELESVDTRGRRVVRATPRDGIDTLIVGRNGQERGDLLAIPVDGSAELGIPVKRERRHGQRRPRGSSNEKGAGDVT